MARGQRALAGETSLRVGCGFDPFLLQHDAGVGHPERPERLDAVNRGLRKSGLLDRMAKVKPRPATRDELLRVHSAAHVERIAATAGQRVCLDPDTTTSPKSYEAARLAAGAAIVATDPIGPCCVGVETPSATVTSRRSRRASGCDASCYDHRFTK